MDNKVNLTNNNNGVLRLPPGFRFYPTDEELVVQYLRRKVLSYPLPAAIIPEADVCKSDPWDLPGGSEQERYFFSTREVKFPNGNRSNRATGSGYWKATGLDKPVVSGRNRQLVGMKRTLVFYKGKPPMGNRTDWVMHEYRLNVPYNAAAAPATQGKSQVLCRIFMKKRSNKIGENEAAAGVVINEGRDGGPPPAPVFYDFLGKERRAGQIQLRGRVRSQRCRTRMSWRIMKEAAAAATIALSSVLSRSSALNRVKKPCIEATSKCWD